MATRPRVVRQHAVILGGRLRQLREGLGLVLQDVADLFHTSRNVPSQWEGGQREPSYEHLLRLADFYGVTTDWLLGREDAAKDSPRVLQFKRQLADYLRLQESRLPTMTPGQRLGLAVTYLISLDPAIFALERLARHLLISTEALEQMSDSSSMATGPVIQRFAQFARLPELWFYQPAPQLEDPAIKYRGILERFQAEGLAPDTVEQRIWGVRRSTRSSGRRTNVAKTDAH